ncbi:hypothetical protein MLD52_01830 [Puniceicoccaceae bacterium K14]|nr:hypothetical protein [Puniceicoccaceae bacterium K14]
MDIKSLAEWRMSKNTDVWAQSVAVSVDLRGHPMRFFSIILSFSTFCWAGFAFEPSEEEKSGHRAEVYQHARNYIAETFNLQILEESEFYPVRFNSKGLWGNYDSRIQDLGDDWFEVKGWCYTLGQSDKKIRWSVVMHLRLEDPNAWRYERLGSANLNEPIFTSWRFGGYWSVPYVAEAGAYPKNSFPDWSVLMPAYNSKDES